MEIRGTFKNGLGTHYLKLYKKPSWDEFTEHHQLKYYYLFASVDTLLLYFIEVERFGVLFC